MRTEVWGGRNEREASEEWEAKRVSNVREWEVETSEQCEGGGEWAMGSAGESAMGGGASGQWEGRRVRNLRGEASEQWEREASEKW